MKLQLATIFLSTMLTIGASSQLVASETEEGGGCVGTTTSICVNNPLADCPNEEEITGACLSRSCGRTLVNIGCSLLGGQGCNGPLVFCYWQAP